MIKIINNKPEPLKHFKDLDTLCCDVENIIDYLDFQDKHIYFISPANSFLFMDGGIDLSYTKMFNGIQKQLQFIMRNNHKTPTSLLGRKYLPIGGALIHKINDKCSIIAAPTMLLPQNIKGTQNAYHAMKAALKIWPGDGILIVPILGGGIGKIEPEEVYLQIKKAIDENEIGIVDTLYLPTSNEINNILNQQPKVYENTEFISFDFYKLNNTDVNK